MLFVGKLDARNAQERVQGINEALAGSNIRILDVRTDDADDVRAKANAADTLVRYPDIKGAGRPLELQRAGDPQRRARGRQGRAVQIVAFDEADETLAGIKAGAHPRHRRAAAVRVRVSGDHADGAGGARRSVVHPGDETDHRADAVVNRANVDEFTQRINTLRGR